MKIWIPKEIFSWSGYVESSTNYSDVQQKRSYEMFSHSEELLTNHESELFLVDGITTLKRTINHRLQTINEYYLIDRVKFTNNSKGLLQKLTQLGIIKPIMLDKLISIRNEIEHRDRKPPPKAHCLELLEFVWYFLRSTDRLVTSVPTDILFNKENNYDSKYWISLETGPEHNWRISLRGWLPFKMVKKKLQKEWIEIETNEIETGREYKLRMKKDKSYFFDQFVKQRNLTDYYFLGTISDESSYCSYIHQLYFNYC